MNLDTLEGGVPPRFQVAAASGPPRHLPFRSICGLLGKRRRPISFPERKRGSFPIFISQALAYFFDSSRFFSKVQRQPQGQAVSTIW
jgi:hypothetical protein